MGRGAPPKCGGRRAHTGVVSALSRVAVVVRSCDRPSSFQCI